jgi:hypothetical protein
MPVFHDPKRRTVTGDFQSVVIDAGWPPEGLVARPNDALGAAILEYVARFKNHPAFPPDGPWDPRTGTINLIPPDQPRPESDEIPRYRLKEFGALGASVYAKGAEVNFSGWPRNPSLLEPMNASAELVLSYMAGCAGRPLPATMPHSGGVLNLPSPGLDGVPQNYTHRASGPFGDAA